jgi:hypothetical protein
MNNLIKIKDSIKIDTLDKYFISNHVLYALGYRDGNGKVKSISHFNYLAKIIKDLPHDLVRIYDAIASQFRYNIPIYSLGDNQR